MDSTADDLQQTRAAREEQELGKLMLQDSGQPTENRRITIDMEVQVRTFKRRWLNLLIYSLFSVCTAYQWIHLSIITNIVLKFYNDSLPQDSLRKQTAADWLSMVYFLSYVITFLPVLWILDSKGLRISILTATTLNVTGTWLKVAAADSNLFFLLLTGQTLCGLSEVYVLPMSPRLAALWFGPDEVSTASSFGVLANQFGTAVGFLLPPVLVPDSQSPDSLRSSLRNMLIGGAVYSSTVWLLVIFLFKDKPPCPPSYAQYLVETSLQSSAAHPEKRDFLHALQFYRNSLLRLLRNRNFLLLMMSYGLITGSYYSVSTLLSNLVLFHHPGKQTSAGKIGLTIIIAGVVASLAAGFWLDKTKAFKSTAVVICAFATLGMVAFAFLLQYELWVLYVTASILGRCIWENTKLSLNTKMAVYNACVLGMLLYCSETWTTYAKKERKLNAFAASCPVNQFFMTGYIPVGVQFAAEITYPEPEGNSSGLLTASAASLAIVITLSMRAMMSQVSVLAANIFVSCNLLIVTVMTGAIQPTYRRQQAEHSVIQPKRDSLVANGTTAIKFKNNQINADHYLSDGETTTVRVTSPLKAINSGQSEHHT